MARNRHGLKKTWPSSESVSQTRQNGVMPVIHERLNASRPDRDFCRRHNLSATPHACQPGEPRNGPTG